MIRGMGLSIVVACIVATLSLQTSATGVSKRSVRQGTNSNEAEAKTWVTDYNEKAADVFKMAVEGSWNYNTNLTEENLQASLKSSETMAKFTIEQAKEAQAFDSRNFVDKALKRELSKISQMGEANLEEDEYKELSTKNAKMTEIYSTAKVCGKPGEADQSRCYPLDPDLSDIMAKSKDLKELEWAWRGWRDASGKKMPDLYKDYTDLQNKAARNNGFKDNGDYWRSWYESASFREDCEKLMQDIMPFYKQLHAYVRRKLRVQHKDLEFSDGGHIPAHVLGNMWAQSWENLESILKPQPDKPDLDITNELIKQNWDVDKIFETSEEFFEGLGMPKMTKEFWDNSMKEKPVDRDVVCHASAWDFYDKKDFRIKQCTEINQKWFITTHHEMGHIAYYEQYKNQPIQFRSGANPGFHEAQADIASLSVATPKYLETIGLIPSKTNSKQGEADLNFLMQQALTKIAFLPFGYMIDQWRWGIFDGSVSRKDYNKAWWQNRCKYQGLSPPVERTEEDFDGGSKYHVPNNTPYIRYFVAHIIQYQFHKSLCTEARNSLPLHQCSIHGSINAGNKLMSMLKMGASEEWSQAMKEITGTEKMSASALLEYFDPLIEWLKKENEGEEVGWEEKCPTVEKASSGFSGLNLSLVTMVMVAIRGFVGV